MFKWGIAKAKERRARVAFLVQYICQMIFYEKSIPVTEVEGLNYYLVNYLPQVTM